MVYVFDRDTGSPVGSFLGFKEAAAKLGVSALALSAGCDRGGTACKRFFVSHDPDFTAGHDVGVFARRTQRRAGGQLTEYDEELRAVVDEVLSFHGGTLAQLRDLDEADGVIPAGSSGAALVTAMNTERALSITGDDPIKREDEEEWLAIARKRDRVAARLKPPAEIKQVSHSHLENWRKLKSVQIDQDPHKFRLEEPQHPHKFIAEKQIEEPKPSPGPARNARSDYWKTTLANIDIGRERARGR